eukprot:16441421-Heterocapsa_arctica.AAC.1
MNKTKEFMPDGQSTITFMRPVPMQQGMPGLSTTWAEGREGPLVDLGTVDDLAGGKWANRIEQLGLAAGYSANRRPLDEPLYFEGVGNGQSTCAEQVARPMCLANGDIFFFDMPVLEQDSELPGLL